MFFSIKYFKEIYFSIFLLTLIVVIGTIGYMAVEGYTVVQAFYMTIITVSTVGFGEIKQFSDEGRLFASFLIITSFGTFAYALGSITQHFVSGDYKKYLKNYKVDQAVSKLTNHVVVCGYGRNGKQAAATLSAFNERVSSSLCSGWVVCSSKILGDFLVSFK